MLPLVYIVVGVHSRGEYDTRPYLENCLKTLKETTKDYRLVFVDDFCDENGSKAIQDQASQYPESYVIRTQKQRWFSRAYNLGMRLTRSEWVVLLNTDTVLYPGWLEELWSVKNLAEMDFQCEVGLVGSVYSDTETRRYARTISPDYVTGHCWLVNMKAMVDCSLDRNTPGLYLDETSQKTIHIFSDNEICERMNRLGYATVQSFKSQVGHHGGRSWGHRLDRISSLTLEQVND